MRIIAALELCQTGARVRPVCWRETNPDHWIELRGGQMQPFFVECGSMEEIPHALRLSTSDEFLGEWETVP